MLLSDWNPIILNKDCTHYPESQKFPSLKYLLDLNCFQDTHCVLYPHHQDYSDYYTSSAANTGATPRERAYMNGQVNVLQSDYVPIAFLDHLGYKVSVKLDNDVKKFLLPKSNPFFKINPAVVDNNVLQDDLQDRYKCWCLLKKI